MNVAPSGRIPEALLPRPVKGGQHRHVLGLRPLDWRDWFVTDDDTEALQANRSRLMAEAPGEVFVAEPGTEVAAEELRGMIAENLAMFHGARPASTTGGHPLAAAAELVADDLILLDTSGDEVRLVAASVCAPNRWKLAVKFGEGLRAVHTPVPGYADQVADVVNTTLTRLDRPVWRSNWGVTDSPAWYQPAAPKIGASIRTAQAAADRLWLRVERQTLVPLPRSKALVFTIRTFQQRLATFADMPQAAIQFTAAIDQLPEPLSRYKDLTRHLPAIRAWLEQCGAATE